VARSERKLKQREALVEKESEFELVREKARSDRTELRDRFIIEVDKAVEEKNQNIADRRYHELQVCKT